jgi:hypothetical protein
MSKIDKTIHKIQKATEKAGSSANQDGLETSGEIRQVKFPGDPNCPICDGIGYLRRDCPSITRTLGKWSHAHAARRKLPNLHAHAYSG